MIIDNKNIDSVVSQQAIEVTIGIFMALTAITYLAVDVDPYLTAVLFWGILIVSNL